MAEPKGATTN
jgi:H+/Cl- antiporter ClcA